MADVHDSCCTIWDWVAGDKVLNHTKACSCGLRKRQALEREQTLQRHRPLRPLGMSEDDWLRTNGIAPWTE